MQPSTKPTKLSTAGTLEKWVVTVQSALAHLSSALASVQFFGRNRFLLGFTGGHYIANPKQCTIIGKKTLKIIV